MTNLLFVVGARPNFMKVAPVLAEVGRRGGRPVLVHTGQHYDEAMSGVFFEELGIAAPDHHLGVGSGSHAQQTAEIMTAFEPLILTHRPDVVVVVGDVNSTVATALVAAKLGAKVAHIEAGLRSRDWTMPEEVNRVVTDRLSQYLFAPSPDAAVNLRAEGYDEASIHVVGNVMVDTLLQNVDRARARPTLADHGVTPHGYALVTLHRPANVDDPTKLAGLLRAISEVATRMPVLFPAHPRVREKLATISLPSTVSVLDPAGYLDFVALLADAALVLTDSGGLQEETTVLGVPCLTLRENTERPITISEGTNRLAGTDPDQIIALALAILDGDAPAAQRPALWDGKASVRIADVLGA